MALTNFAALTTEQKTVWSRDIWSAARNMSFINQFAGKGANSMVQRITELTKSERGARAVLTLVTDLEGDGVMGDSALEDNEEAIKAYDQVVQIDQLRNANRTTGKMTDQKTVVNFRETSKDVLAYWLADRIDQMAFLTLSGVAYTETNNGVARTVNAAGYNLNDLAFAADVTAPSTNRYVRWDTASSGSLLAGANNVDTLATPSYKMLVELKAYAKDHYVRGIRGEGNSEYYHVFMTPQGIAKLKLDSDFLANVRNAGPRGMKNPLFSGSLVTQDGLIIHEFRHVYNTKAAASGSRWGATGTIHGQRVLLCGAQALAMADIGMAEWNEDTFDYGNQHGIEVGKIFGFLKPVFNSIYDGSSEDFGVVACDTAI